VLLILDGWGHREETADNAIAQARLPNWDALLASSPHTLIHTEGRHVGLPDGQMGNSEVGHMNLGAGRIVYQDLTRIDAAVEDGSFFTNPELRAACAAAKANGGTLHLLGLVSPGGVHSHEAHIAAMLELARREGVAKVAVHAFLDGRDVPPRSARPSLQKLQQACAQAGNAHIASVCGRYYAMDRDQRWDRLRKAWDAIVEGRADHRAADALTALDEAYARGETDEFVAPTVIAPAEGEPPPMADGDAVVFMNFRADRARQLAAAFVDPTVIGESLPMADGDAVVFMNFRADRARQLAAAFVSPAFTGFQARRPALSRFVCLTEYDARLPAPVAFAPDDLRNTLGEVLSDNGMRQLRIAETEKYAHVTFFFSGGREDAYAGETRILVPSPNVATYDLQPEMSCPEVTEKLTAAIRSGDIDVAICNIANPDMVGHSGNLAAAVKAVEAVDIAIGAIVAAVRDTGGAILVTADHGNVEMMRDPVTGQPHTSHTVGPVPLVYVGPRSADLRTGGSLRDIAPTLLDLLGLPKPEEMTGHSLLLDGRLD
jgi:2,3-bisphosphoglycerate-independent phosphoglycerate mutase